jgi:hypothetical protein
MSQIEGIAKTVAWSTGFALLGLTAGTLVDGILGDRVFSMSKQPLIRGLTQFVIGVAVLAETVAVVIPADTVAPVSDGLMFYWFMESQPHLRESFAGVSNQIKLSLFGSGRAAKLAPSTPKPDCPTPSCPPPSSGAPALDMVEKRRTQQEAEDALSLPMNMVNPWDARPLAQPF